MKRKILMFVSILMIGILVACGSNGEQAVTGDQSDSNEQTNNTDKTAEDVENNGKKITITLGHQTPPGGIPDFVAEKLQEELNERTNGRVEIEVYGNAQLGPDLAMLEQIQLGTLDAGLLTTTVFPNFVPNLEILDMPLLFNDLEHARNALDGEIGQELAAQMDEAGLHVLTFYDLGFAHIVNNNKPIRTPEDLKGFKIRATENEVNVATFGSFGANVVPISFPEVYTSLQQGVVDGAVLAIEAVTKGKFYEIVDYMTLLPTFYFASALVINSDKYNSLDDELKTIIADVAKEITPDIHAHVDQVNKEGLKIIEDNGVEIIKEDEIDMEAFRKSVEPVYDKFGSKYGDLVERIRVQ